MKHASKLSKTRPKNLCRRPMEEVIGSIEKNRMTHGYSKKAFLQYKRFCNSKIRHSANGHLDSLIYRLESNTAKFMQNTSLRFLYKNLRILKKSADNKEIDEDFVRVYSFYVECLIEGKKGIITFDKLLELRSLIADFYTFTNDVYDIDDNKHSFDQYKVRHYWHDVELIFENQRICDSFINGSFSYNDSRFYTQLGLLITRFDKAKKAFLDVLEDTSASLSKIQLYYKSLSSSIQILEAYAKDNFVSLGYIIQIKNSIDMLAAYIASLFLYQNGTDDAISEIDFDKLEGFEDHERKILKNLDNHKFVNASKLRSLLLEAIKMQLTPKTENRKLPFLPVFYDLAYDYIQYPQEKTSISSLFRRLSFLGKK